MDKMESGAGDAKDVAAERTIMLVLTLIVTTVIVAFAVYVLGSAMVGAGAGPYGHRAGIAAIRQPA